MTEARWNVNAYSVLYLDYGQNKRPITAMHAVDGFDSEMRSGISYEVDVG